MNCPPALATAAQKWGLAILHQNNEDGKATLSAAWRTDKRYIADALVQRLGHRHEDTFRESQES